MLTVCAAGYRGALVVDGLLEAGVRPDRVVGYPQKGDPTRAFERIEATVTGHGLRLDRGSSPTFVEDEWVMFVGWQYRVEPASDRMIVFHDSLLPRYRGFASTVTALINGDAEIGVTAIRPVGTVDAGPVLGQRHWTVTYPVKALDAMERQSRATVELALELLGRIDAGRLAGVEQDHAAATHSLWRDEQDYFIDWSLPADAVCRTVDALGYPFAGARTRVDGQEILVDEARPADDLVFERRDIGKVWSLGPDGPVVVCGQGCVRLTAVRTSTGAPFAFERMRHRLT